MNREALLRHLETSLDHVINSSTCVLHSHACGGDVTQPADHCRHTNYCFLLLGSKINYSCTSMFLAGFDGANIDK